MNQSESESIAHCLETAGWHHSHDAKSADVCIVNTCAVTGKASMQSRQAVRRAIRSVAGNAALTVVTGCHAQTDPDEIAEIDGVGMIIGHGDKHRIPEILESLPNSSSGVRIEHRDIRLEKTFSEMPAVAFGSRSRPFLKIQDGCDAFCSYCIVPYARGRSRSMPVDTVMRNIAQFGQAGYKEIVLTGVHLGCYGKDLSPVFSLGDLTDRIVETKPIDRVRMSSVEPHELTDKIIRNVADSDILCDHFHIPLQSGDDGILESMRRPYTNAQFEKLIMKIARLAPDAAIGADTLIGFPGESDAAFENTFSLVERLPISYLHVFPFSPRKGTRAEKLSDTVTHRVITERCERMRALGARKRKAFYEKFAGRTAETLVVNVRDRATGMLRGITSNYIPVLIDGPDTLKNRVIRVKIEKPNESNLVFGITENNPK